MTHTKGILTEEERRRVKAMLDENPDPEVRYFPFCGRKKILADVQDIGLYDCLACGGTRFSVVFRKAGKKALFEEEVRQLEKSPFVHPWPKLTPAEIAELE